MSMATSIRVRGQVQGVGFRPFVWHLATESGITGNVWNDAEGVLIQAWGDKAVLENFQKQIQQQAPPLARIDSIEYSLLDAEPIPETFTIKASPVADGIATASVTPDAATCPHCLMDIHNPSDPHHGYPFTSCTYCGPRLSIVRSIPYDRANTSMAPFRMCEACQTEFDNPADRRFHAQTSACPECGPQLWLEDGSGNKLELASSEQIISRTASLLQEGHVVAIKGIGGVHLAVDAGNDAAVSRLRTRKQRYAKAFALMAADIESIARYASVKDAEAQLLTSTAAPIVLLARNPDSEQLPEGIAPGQSRLGFMLPYSPLHSLLMRQLNRPIVLTSGNRSDEPQCIDNDDARKRLSGIADYFLLHDRDIVNRLDDSVAAVMDGKPRLLRRARGYAPAPILLHESFANAPRVLAMGGELKNTFCQLDNGKATISQHLGDLENAATHSDYRQALSLYAQMYGFDPEAIAVDMHPDYFSTRLGHGMADDSDLPLIAVQHHHAHVAAVLAEHQLPLDTPPVLGIALDGLGFGEDGTIWGGEFLYVDYSSSKRLGCCQQLPMPGGAQAMIEPWRNTFAHLHALGWGEIEAAFGDSDIVRFLSDKPVPLLNGMIERKVNSPLTSSCGRLFDAVAAALGICREHAAYEGQAAIELETLAQQAYNTNLQPYPYRFDTAADGIMHISWQPMWQALLNDLIQGIEHPIIAARFHRTAGAAISEMATQLCHKHIINTVALCGGVFQNRLLLETVASELRHSGQQVLIPRHLPLNDGGICLGQAVVAAAKRLKDKTT